MRPTLLVLAAGQGTRFGGRKQIEPVGPRGETLLDYAVFDAVRAGFGRVVFVVGSEFATLFESRVASRYAGRLEVACVCQRLDDLPPGCSVPSGRSRPWGTLHAVLAARQVLDGPFVVINADDFYGRDAYVRSAEFFRAATGSAPQDACLVAYALAHTLSGHGGVNRGICVQGDGLLQGVVEHTDIVAETATVCRGTDPAGRRVVIPSDVPVSMNCWGFTPAILRPMTAYFDHFLRDRGTSLVAECYLPSMVNDQLQAGALRVRVLRTDADWFGITYPGDKARCVAAIQALVVAGEYGPPAGIAPESP